MFHGNKTLFLHNWFVNDTVHNLLNANCDVSTYEDLIERYSIHTSRQEFGIVIKSIPNSFVALA